MGQWVEMHSKVGVLEEIQSTQEDQFMQGLVKVAATDEEEEKEGDHDYDYEPIKEVDLRWIYDKKVVPDANRKERDGLYKSVKFTREWLEDSEGVLDEYGEHEAAVEVTPTNYEALTQRFPLLVLDFMPPGARTVGPSRPHTRPCRTSSTSPRTCPTWRSRGARRATRASTPSRSPKCPSSWRRASKRRSS